MTMEREEAIKTLQHCGTENYCRHYIETGNCYGCNRREALNMAIEALYILGDDGIVNCCGCIHWETDGGAMMMCELWDTPMGDFDYCSYGEREGGDSE